MAVTDTTPLIAENLNDTAEIEHARQLSVRYRCPFLDLREQSIKAELVRSIPAELMFRYNFVPLELDNATLTIAIADPSHFQLIDELALHLGKRLQIKVAPSSQINNILKRTEQSQRVLDRASEGFALKVLSEDENSTKISPWKSSPPRSV